MTQRTQQGTRQVTWQVLAPGKARGQLQILAAPLSFWGGYDPVTGTITDARHPNAGLSCRGRILAMAQSKGSSSASSVLAEAIRLGTAPAAIILGKPCGILTTGAMVAKALYGIECPIIVTALWPLPLPAMSTVQVDTSVPDSAEMVRVLG